MPDLLGIYSALSRSGEFLQRIGPNDCLQNTPTAANHFAAKPLPHIMGVFLNPHR